MSYVCLIHLDERDPGGMAPSELDAFLGGHFAFTERIRKSGHYLPGGQKLEPVQAATTVRVRNGKLSITDGPFAETREQLAGFSMIEARDLNEAIQLAARIPPARVGSIEVRPIRPIRETVQAEAAKRAP